MKNDFCSLTESEIKQLPERYHSFFFSPFQHNRGIGNLHQDMIAVPIDTFKEMIGILVEKAIEERKNKHHITSNICKIKHCVATSYIRRTLDKKEQNDD